MKKVSIALFLLFTVFCVYAQNGVITEMTGIVELMQAGADIFIPATAGTAIDKDTVISTGFRSFAIIQVGHTTISVRPLTRLSLTELQTSEETETLNVNLQSGRVRVDVKPPAGTRANVSTRTPSSVASVRGTSFELDTRSIYVIQGSVTFTGNRGRMITVRAGEESRVSANSSALIPVELKTGDLYPTSLPGTSSSGGTTTGPARMGVEYIFNLEFQ